MNDLGPYEVDNIIYFIATSQEAEYQEMLTGDKPAFPVPNTEDAREDQPCAQSPVSNT